MISRSDAQDRDFRDPLATFRGRFALPSDTIYLDGNSLGALPRGVEEILRDVIGNQWGNDLIRGWNTHDWIGMPARVGEKLARVIGAANDEVIVADSTSINLFKLLVGALRARPGRATIVMNRDDFPTDLYVAEGVADLLGEPYRVVRVTHDGLAAAIDRDTAVVAATQIDFRTGEALNLAHLCDTAHQHGALFLCDLSHSAGVMPLDLNGLGVDLAVGCGYKYLNGGPGAPAFLFVAKHLQTVLDSPIWGWMGHASPFAFGSDYQPAPGVRRFLAGTPAVLGLAALNHALESTLAADIDTVRAKSLALTDLFMELVDQECRGFGLEIVTPRSENRGSQVSLRHPSGYPIVQALIGRGVIGDFRSPDILRFGFAPLYIRYLDVWDAVSHLKEVMISEVWRQPEFQTRAAVT